MEDLYLTLQVNCNNLLKAIDGTKLEATEVSKADLQSALNQLDVQIQSEGMHAFCIKSPQIFTKSDVQCFIFNHLYLEISMTAITTTVQTTPSITQTQSQTTAMDLITKYSNAEYTTLSVAYYISNAIKTVATLSQNTGLKSIADTLESTLKNINIGKIFWFQEISM